MNRTDGQSGFTFVEVLVASVLLVVGVLGLLTAFGQVFRDTTNAGRGAVLNHLATEKLEELRALPFDDTDLDLGVHPDQAADSSGARYYPVARFDEEFSLRWEVSGGPTNGAGAVESGLKTIVVDATYLVRYTMAGEPLRNVNSFETVAGTLVTD